MVPQSVDDASKPRLDGSFFFFLLESSAEAASSAGSEGRDAGHGNHLGPHTKLGWRFPQAVLTISATSLVSPCVLCSPLTLPAQALFWGEPPVSYLIWLAFWGKKDLYPSQAGAGTLSLLKLKLRCPELGPRSTVPQWGG